MVPMSWICLAGNVHALHRLQGLQRCARRTQGAAGALLDIFSSDRVTTMLHLSMLLRDLDTCDSTRPPKTIAMK